MRPSPIPALLTRMSTRPAHARVDGDHQFDARVVGHVDSDGVRPRAARVQSPSERFGGLELDVRHHDTDAVAHESLGHGGAERAGGTGDDRDACVVGRACIHRSGSLLVVDQRVVASTGSPVGGGSESAVNSASSVSSAPIGAVSMSASVGGRRTGATGARAGVGRPASRPAPLAAPRPTREGRHAASGRHARRTASRSAAGR